MREALTELGRKLAKEVPGNVGVTFDTVGEDGKTVYEHLLEQVAGDEDATQVLKMAKVMEGTFTSYGAHAAGIVISDNEDVSDYIPLRNNEKFGMFTTQCDMVQTEESGLLKFDFLGLKTLDIITDTVKMIEKTHGIIIDPDQIDLEDAKVLRSIYSAGKTNSIFQFESAGMKQMLKRFKPSCFADLIILVSMFRPGPLQYLDDVIAVKNGEKEMTFLCPQLEPILGDTYGAIVYQEQVMAICQELAGFTRGHADQVRRYMSKKKAEKLAHEREIFISGCGEKGISEDIANALFDQMMDFASYAFNKSHAAAYSKDSFITGWLKYYYPAEFYAAALNWAANNEKIAILMNDAQKEGLKLHAPNINLSEKEFTIVDGEIYFGLGSVAGVKNHADSILSERKNGRFTSMQDFCVRCNPSSAVLKNLIEAGAFDDFSRNRQSLLKVSAEIMTVVKKLNTKMSFISSAEFCLNFIEKAESSEEIVEKQLGAGLKAEIKEKTTAARLQGKIDSARKIVEKLNYELSIMRPAFVEEDASERMNREHELLGVYVTAHPMDGYPSAGKMEVEEISEISSSTDTIYGVISNITARKTRKGDVMAVLDVEDRSGKAEVVVFPKTYVQVKNQLKTGSVYVFKGRAEVTEIIVTDGDGCAATETSFKFYLKSLETVKPAEKAIMIEVSSYAVFHVTDAEKIFIKNYGMQDGRTLLIKDHATGEIREALFTVSPKTALLPGACEVFC